MIEPDFLDELARFESSLKRASTEIHQGDQQSPNVGEGLTFSDFRRYSPGDDTRLIDWRLYGRTEEFFIKVYEEERNLTVHVLLDASASMDFGEGSTNKFEYAAKLGLGFCYLTAEENNQFRFSTFRDRPQRLDTGTSTRGELLTLIDLLNETTPTGAADFQTVCEEYAGTISSKSLVLVLSDFLADPDAIEEGLAALARNELIVTQVLTPEELDPEPMGDTIFSERETDETRRTYFGGSLARTYRSRLEAHINTVGERAEDMQATHALVDSGSDFFDAFASVWVN